ncbi:MAG TPA: DUF456 domain-containing protein [Planctomycetota bacterium]|nr:DUF456 domain-containing protein [Planctomycetota bacterium]
MTDILYAILLLAVNAVGVLLVAMSLPGTWVIVLATAAAVWLGGESGMVGTQVLIATLGLAVLAEVVEFAAGAVGTRRAGGSTWGAAGAILGGIAGGILGTFYILIPVVGSILGAAIGALCGAVVAERLAGRPFEEAVRSGKGAFVGRLLGTVSKVAISVVMWIVVAFACFL